MSSQSLPVLGRGTGLAASHGLISSPRLLIGSQATWFVRRCLAEPSKPPRDGQDPCAVFPGAGTGPEGAGLLHARSLLPGGCTPARLPGNQRLRTAAGGTSCLPQSQPSQAPQGLYGTPRNWRWAGLFHFLPCDLGQTPEPPNPIFLISVTSARRPVPAAAQTSNEHFFTCAPPASPARPLLSGLQNIPGGKALCPFHTLSYSCDDGNSNTLCDRSRNPFGTDLVLET